jgi:site-specific DNA-methyltransferase (adenine-specific)
MEWTKSIWNMKPEYAKRIGHPAPFPTELPFRLLQLFSFKGDVVLDPFIGSGTTALAAMQSARNYVGFEISDEYCKLADTRISNASDTMFNDV